MSVPAPVPVGPARPAATGRRTRGDLVVAGLLTAVAVLVLVGFAAPGLRPPALGPVLVVLASVAAVVLWRSVAGGRAQRGWRLVAAGVVLSTAGVVIGTDVDGPGSSTLLGLPGQVVSLLGVVCMMDRAAWRERRLQLCIALALFVDAAVLTGYGLYSALGVWDRVAGAQATAGLVVTLLVGGLRPGVALLLCLTVPRGKRRMALLLMVAEATSSLGWLLVNMADGVLVAGLPLPTAPSLPAAAFAVSIALFLLSQRLDRSSRPPDPDQRWSLSGSVVAVLPHLTAWMGGSVLLLDAARSQQVTGPAFALGITGLGLIAVHQLVVDAQQQRLTAQLARSEAYFRTLARTSASPILIVDDELRVSWSSPSLVDLLGEGAGELVGHRVTNGVHRDDLPTVYAALSARQPAGSAETRSRTARVRHSDGSWRLIEITARDLREDADVGAMVLYLREVAGARTVDLPQTSLEYADQETGLPSRPALVQRLTGLLRELRPGTEPVTLVTLAVSGLDGARVLGPDAETDLRRQVVTTLARGLRSHDWLAQRSPDSFSVLVGGSVSDAETLAQRLVDAVVSVPSGAARLTAVAGVLPLGRGAGTDGESLDAGEALRRADLALAGARETGPGSVRRYDDALRAAQGRRDQLRTDLAGALARGELRMVYQPVVDLALHAPAGVEALMRWQHPEFGAVSPADFIPLAEESGLIVDLGRWALVQACTATGQLAADELYVAVNVSARHVLSGQVVDDVVSALASSGLRPDRLVLEITESVLLDELHITDDLEALRQLGVRIAVDDFGTGWSSLARLVSLPIDVLKMDRAFLTDLETDPQRRSLCRSVLQLGSSLGLAVIVEGVERTAELQLLQDMGHRFVQGFLLARPMELAQLTDRLADHDWTTALVRSDR
ncbi:EAL domain-containing protein [Modestobacter sp. I12A-02628]|uniref:EAL domain-containing protein n=1 Tax=Goekera deserti TaxID=2497753 RepID=A0A7K3WF25_9ACTN|nr:EAL domain-containing protein [Goekera deserti]MPQ97884.1 EAL domain-containing protein [Goekera deserti]NDI48530.1 EAL domain-containing protein [Goekera deserti]NEL55091.1 EAL domain-containing protein [Goekera deserti]